MADDFTLPDGRVVGANLNNFESVHRDFALNCKSNVNHKRRNSDFNKTNQMIFGMYLFCLS